MRALVLATGVSLIAATASAQEMAARDGWADLLRQQMLDQENCVVSFLGEVTERQNPYLVRAKVTCEDQRVFSVEQNIGPEQPFRVVVCNREGPKC